MMRRICSAKWNLFNFPTYTMMMTDDYDILCFIKNLMTMKHQITTFYASDRI